MSKQRVVDTCFWDDAYIQKLDPSEKLLFLYLLTNPLTNICGVYEIGLRRMAFDTGFDQDMVSRILGRFEVDDRCRYAGGWIAMKNWSKHQSDSPKVRKGIEIGLAAAPKELVEYVGLYPMHTISDPNLIESNPNVSEASAKQTFASNVAMTQDEYQKLIAKHGPDLVTSAVELLDNYKGETGKRYKSDYHAILSWGIQAALERREKGRGKGGGSPGVVQFKGRRCEKCGEVNTHSGSMCMKCNEELPRRKA
jgi:hypothetical protein